jgi:hypothetical protein
VDIGLLEKLFTSERYGYSVLHPIDWTSVPASLDWTSGNANLWGSGYNDELSGTNVRFSGAAQALAPGQTADEWLATYADPVAALASGGDPSTWPRVTIDGVEGRIDYDGRPALGGTVSLGGVMFDAVVVSGPYAYNFNMDGAVDRATFEAVLATVKLPVIPDTEKTFTSPINGYSMARPGSWTATPATKAWSAGYDASDPALSDRIGTTPLFTGTSTKIPTGMAFDDWYAAYDQERASGTCRAAAAAEPVSIDGAVGRLDLHCPTFYLEAVVPSGGRAYVFTLYAPASRPVFLTLLRGIDLTPATARN